MSLLNDVIGAALREHNIPQVGSGGTSPLVDALRSLLAPRSTAAGATPEETHAEPDALGELLRQFQQGGYANIIRSWIGTGPNQSIEAHQLGQVLGSDKVDELADQTGLSHETLLQQLARLLPTVIDGLSPQGKLP
jgi:uncharacterized protein YidB (DUF937 family)